VGTKVKATRNRPKAAASAITERKQVEKALSYSEQYFRPLLERALDVVVVLNSDGTIRYESPSIQNVIGYKPGERQGKSFFNLIHPDDMASATSALSQLLQNQAANVHIELRIRHKDGSWRSIEAVSQNLLDDPAVAGIVVNFRDITERKQAEEALRENEERLRLITDNVSDVIWTMDMDLNFTYISPSTQRLIGYTPEEETAIGLSGILTPESLEVAWKTYEQTLAAEESTDERKPFGSVTVELDHIHKDGSIVPTDVRMTYLRDNEGRLVGILGITRDMTKYKQAEETLRESGEKYRTILEDIEEGYYEVDIAGNLTFFNDAMCRIIGYSRDEMMGMNNRQYMDEENAKKVYQAFNRVYTSGKHAEEFGWEIVRKDGTKRFIEASVSLKRNSEGAPIGFRGIVRDITERKQMEEELRVRDRALGSSINATALADLEGRLNYVNPSFLKLWGYDNEKDVIGKSAVELWGTGDQAAAVIAALFKGGAWRGESVASRKDGSMFDVQISASMVTDVDGKPICMMASFMDVTKRKVAEKALRESEEKFRRLVDEMNDGYCVLRGFRVVFVNARSAEMFGYTQEEVVGKTVQELLPAEIVDELSKMRAKRQRGEAVPHQYETILVGKEGTIRPVELGTRVIEYAGKPALSVVIRDITERKQAEEALREKEELFRALIENSSDAIAVVSGDGIIRYESPSVERVLGYKPEELIGKDVLQFIHPDDVQLITKSFAMSAENPRRTLSTEVRFLHKDGSWRVLEGIGTNLLDDPKVNGIVANYRDVTERKWAEETLLLKEKAIENSVSAIAMSDMEGRVTYLNRACMRFWGEEYKEELLGKPYWLLIKSDDVVKDIATAMFKNDSWEGELVAARKNGEEVTVRVSAAMVRDEHGNPIQTISSFLDITELKRLEEEKQRMEEQLQITGRLAAVGELTAGVAHELNNPLAAIQAYAELLSERDDLDETTKSDVETIYKEAKRASRITSNLLSFARRYKPEKSLISINDVIRKSLELHAYRMKVNNIEIVTDLDPDLPMLMADFHQMQQVFVNIITNAEQAMTEVHGRGSLHIKTQIADETIQITFADSGPGIPEDNLKRIFDPFFTTKDVGEGTGLGLSICYGIIQEHGGYLYARSKPGQGATFVVEIPVIPEDYLIGEEVNSTHYLQSIPRHL